MYLFYIPDVLSTPRSNAEKEESKANTVPEFIGHETLEVADIKNWTVPGLGKIARPILKEMGWNGEPVVVIGLSLSENNQRVADGRIYLHGELQNVEMEFIARNLWEQAERNLSIQIRFKDVCEFTFNDGTCEGDLMDSSEISWEVTKRKVWVDYAACCYTRKVVVASCWPTIVKE